MPEHNENNSEKPAKYMTDYKSGTVYEIPESMTEEQAKNPVSSGAVQWHDPLDKPVVDTEHTTGKLAVASLLLGIAGVCMLCSIPAALLLGTAGLVCGILSAVRHEDGRGIRIAGIILSASALTGGILLLLLRVVFHLADSSVSQYYQDIDQSIGA